MPQFIFNFNEDENMMEHYLILSKRLYIIMEKQSSCFSQWNILFYYETRRNSR